MRMRTCERRLVSLVAFVAIVAPGCAGKPPNGFVLDGGAGDGGPAGSLASGGSGSGSSSGSGTSDGGGNGGFGSGSSSGSGGPGSSSGADAGGGGGEGTCAPTIAASAITLTSNYLAATIIGDGGYAYSYRDGMGSTACLDSTAFCGAGSTAVANPAGTVWGAGIGFSLNQAMATGPASPPVSPYAVPVKYRGISYALSALPTQGARLVIDDKGTDYCALLTAASGSLPWASFNTQCWNGGGSSLPGAPQAATHVHFQITATSVVAAFDVCVTAVSFSP